MCLKIFKLVTMFLRLYEYIFELFKTDANEDITTYKRNYVLSEHSKHLLLINDIFFYIQDTIKNIYFR